MFQVPPDTCFSSSSIPADTKLGAMSNPTIIRMKNMAVMRRLLMALSFWNRLYPFSLHLRRNSKGEPSETGAFQWVPMRYLSIQRVFNECITPHLLSNSSTTTSHETESFKTVLMLPKKHG